MQVKQSAKRVAAGLFRKTETGGGMEGGGGDCCGKETTGLTLKVDLWFNIRKYMDARTKNNG